MTLSQIVSNANGFTTEARTTGDLTSLKFTRDGYIYDLDYEYLARNSQIQNLIYLKDGDVIHLPDSSENLVHVLGEAFQPKSIKMERSTILLSSAISQASGLNKTTAKGRDVFVYRPNDFEENPEFLKQIYHLHQDIF